MYQLKWGGNHHWHHRSFFQCIALLDKYYGHQHYRIHFAHAELQCQNDDVQSGNHHELVNTYTREQIEVEYILDCLFTKSKIQKSPDAHNILANSILEIHMENW